MFKMIKVLARHISLAIVALVITSASPLVFVSTEIKQLNPTTPDDMYEVYKSGFPFRWLERSSISQDRQFNKVNYWLDVVFWYCLLVGSIFLVKKVRKSEGIHNKAI